MVKSIFKEIIILILIAIIVCLLLIILFYDYDTENKVVSQNVKAFELSDDLKQELDLNSNTESIQKYIRTYKVDSSDLKTFENDNTYNAGKANPFMESSDLDSVNNDNNLNINTNKTTNTTKISNTENTNNITYFNTIGK